MKNRNLLIRLGYACSGLAIVWRRERSFRIHTACALAAVVALAVMQASLVWIALVCLAITLVLAFEMLNSSIEYLLDHLHPEISGEIGHAKDAGAGAVLVASAGALAVALLLAAGATG